MLVAIPDIHLYNAFYKKDSCNKFVEAVDIKNTTAFIEVIADEATIKERLKRKRTDSDADYEVYKKIKQQWEPLEEPHLLLKSTDDNIEDLLRQAADYIQIRNDSRINK